MMKNKHGIPIIPPPPLTPHCINKHTHRPKARFASKFLAERFVAEVIQPKDRHLFRPYACGDHWHLTAHD
jgi:hypothetical protein